MIVKPPPLSCLACTALHEYCYRGYPTVECSFTMTTDTSYVLCCCSNCLIKSVCSDPCENFINQVIESPSSRGRFKINDEINNRKEIIYSIKQDWEDERNLLNLNMKNVRQMTEIIEELNKKYYS